MSGQSNDNMLPMQPNSGSEALDALIDYSGGDSFESISYNSTPAMSPTTKATFTRSAGPVTSDTIMSSTQQPMAGPSHQYDLYKNQTGIPTGALANTFAMTQDPSMYNYGYSSGFNQVEDFNDFKPQQGFNGGIDMDADFGASPSNDPAYFYPEQSYINPSAIEEVRPIPPVLLSQSNNVNRFFPGMHSQQALAKAQAQQKQQQELIQRQNSISSSTRHSRNNSKDLSDRTRDEKISQLLSSMRQSSIAASENEHAQLNNMSSAQRMRKDEEDMDEDERLLASEEGKKLSSKERRQLRNKVSARAFRSRRKEYIGQLEGEIAVKINENADLRSQNRALMEENTRLSDLTRMLLSSEAFSGFFDNLTQSQNAPVIPQQQAQPKVEPRQQQMRKDINPYQPHMQMAIIPEQNIDFNMLELQNETYSYQPQVFAVLEIPEPQFEASVLSGKTTSSGIFASNLQKIEAPVIDRYPLHDDTVVEAIEESEDEEFNNDPAFTLFRTATPTAQCPLSIDLSTISNKLPISVTIIDAKASVEAAMQRVDRLCSTLDTAMAMLESYTIDY